MNNQIAYLIGLGADHIQRGNLVDAERLLGQAQRMAPRNPEIYRLLGVICAFRRDPEAALVLIEKALKIDSNNWLAHSNKGNLLKELSQPQAALKSFQRAIRLEPKYAEAHNNIGNLYLELGQPQEAIKSFQVAIGLQPNYAQAYGNLGNALEAVKDLKGASAAFKTAMQFGDESSLLKSSCINCNMKLFDWTDLDGLLADIENVNSNKNSHRFLPLVLSLVCDKPHLLKKITKEYIEVSNPTKHDLGPIPLYAGHKRIRVGYYSPDFRNHPVSYLIAGMIEAHNKERFELIAFSMGNQTSDEMRTRLEPHFSKMVDVSSMSDLEIARLSRTLEIDIAIDLCGLTSGARPSIFAYRAAPVQVGYIGYLGTMAAEYIDYIIADSTIIPEDLRDCYSEKIIYLPSYQANDQNRKISDKVFSREELGLPKSGFIFCCFNNSLKITPSIFDSWIRILKATPGSVLYLYVENEDAKNNLLCKLDDVKVDRSRLIFGGALPYSEYLARYRVADLFLDTSPYNAGATASDALWAGLPVLTFMGSSFSARIGASILRAINLPQLIAKSQADYEDLAISLAKNPEKLMEIKRQLARNRSLEPLFNTQLFTKNLELAYEKIYTRSQGGLAPDHII